ncbi:MAG: ArsR/SmtB family transcription factor [Methanobacterium formicicum]
MNTQKMAKVFKALSNPNRLDLYLKIVAKQETSYKTGFGCLINDIAKSLNIGAPTVSHHLKELSNAELIFTERKGKYLVARVNEEMINEVNELLKFNKDLNLNKDES